jgi:hypothetical protein
MLKLRVVAWKGIFPVEPVCPNEALQPARVGKRFNRLPTQNWQNSVCKQKDVGPPYELFKAVYLRS